MSVVDSIKDKWYVFSDWLDEKGIPKPLFFLLIVLLIVGVIYFLYPGLFSIIIPPGKAELTVSVIDKETEEPLEGANVLIEVDGEILDERITGKDGKVEFDIPIGKIAKISATYKESSGEKTVKILEDQRIELGLEVVPEITFFSKEARFVEKDGSLYRKKVKFRAYCQGEGSYEKTATTSVGTYLLEEIPSNCGVLGIEVLEVSGVDEVEGSFSGYVEEGTENIEVEIIERITTGNVYVYVKTLDQKIPTKRCDVELIAVKGGQDRSLPLDASGVAPFEDTRAGTYKARVNCHGSYSEEVSEEKELKPDSTIEFHLFVEETMPKTIKVIIHEKGREDRGVKGIKLELYDGAVKVDDGLTNNSGEYIFEVEFDKEYNLVAKKGEKPLFTAPQKVRPRDEPYKFPYDSTVFESASALIVIVKDEEGELLEGVKIELFYENGDAAGYEGFTGADGRVEFETLPAATYYLTASIPGFKPEPSKTFTIIENNPEPELVEVVLKIGKGAYEFTVMDSMNNPLPNADIKGIDLRDASIVAEETSDNDGMAKFTVRMDKKPFFVVTLPGYMPFVTEPLKPIDGVTARVEVIMLEETAKLEIKFNGLMYNDAVADGFVEPGQSYQAKVQLIVPNKSYSTAGIHFRTGKDEEGRTNVLEDDIVAIGSVQSNAQKVVKSSSFSPPKGTGTDLGHATSGTAKWTNIEWKLGQRGLPEYGVFNATIEVLVDDLATEGDVAKISYRGWVVKGGYDRDPVDSVLGSAASVSEKQGLYAKTYDVIYSVGLVNLCLDGYCRIVSIEDLLTNSKLSVFDKFSANASNPYKMRFTINKAGPGTIRNAKLRISNNEKGLYFKDYSVKDALGGESLGTVNGFELLVDIGTLEQYKTFSGWIEFDTVKDGVNSLVLAIESESGVEMEQQINIEVVAGKEMKLDMVPREIVPMIDNQMLFRLYEETEEGIQAVVQGAFVTVSIDGTEIGSGYTDSEGVFALEIEAPKAGSKIKITARKSGFKPLEMEIEVDDKIITLIPSSVNLDMMPYSREEAIIEFSIENATAIPLEISNITLSPELTQYLKIKELDQIIGLEIGAGEIKEIALSVELTEKGILSEKTVSAEGFVGIEVENKELNRKWVSDLGLKFRILLGGEVDIRDCLYIEPTEWNIKTYGSEKTMSFDIRNNCTVNGSDTPLRSLDVKVSWLNENAVGEFKLVSDSFEERTDLTLSESYARIVELMPAGFEGTLIVSFKPSAETKSAEMNPEILFRARHFSENGSEEIKNKVKVSLTVNKLTECLKIVSEEDIELRTQPYNYGWGLIEGYYDRDPYAEGTTEEQPQMPWWQQPIWPTSSYQYPFQSGYGYNPLQPQHSQWQPEEEEEEGSFTLENACTDTVQVNLQAPSALEIEEKSFEIEPYGSYDVTITPTARIGRFKVKVRAKLKSEQGFYKDIDSVKVRVMRFEEISEKCKPTVEPTYFRATFLGWQKSAGRIINRCVDLGYRLKPLTREVFHCYRPDSLGTDMKGPCPLIEQVWSGTPRIQETNENERIEILEFGLKYDPHIIEQLPIPVEGTIEQRIGKIRIVFSRLMNSLISPGVISIPILDPRGRQKWIPREVIFEDPFEWIGVPGMLITNGDPNKLPEECILNPNYFVLESWGEEWAIIGDIHFTENRFAWKERVPKREMLLPYAVANDEVAEEQYCGSSDKIVSIKPTVYEDNDSGVKLTFKTSGSGHHVVMTIDRSGMFTKCAVVETNLTVRVKRAFYNTEPADVILPVKVSVLNRGVDAWTEGCEEQALEERPIPEWVESEACSSELTGPAVYEELGFDRIKLSWRAGEIASDSCDPVLPGTETINDDYFFCDAVQFSLALSKKFNEIRSLVDRISLKLKKDSEFKAVASVISENNELVDEINSDSGKLFHLYKKQLIVHDSTSGNKYLIFMTETATGSDVLEPELLSGADCKLGDIRDEIQGIIDNLTSDNERDASTLLPKKLSKFERELKECYGRDIDHLGIVGLIPMNIDSIMENAESEANEIWSSFKNILEMHQDPDLYIMAYNEYQQLHSQLLIQWRTNYDSGYSEASLRVDIEDISIDAPKEAWIEFLNNLHEFTEFKVGIRNKAGLREETEEYIRENASDALEEDFTKLSSTELSQARLIKDNYSRTFVEDFTNYYKDLGFSADQLEFQQYASYNDEKGFSDEMTSELPASGEYKYRIEPFVLVDLSDSSNYSIVLNKMIVKVALELRLEEINVDYTYNPFFYLPFDGEIGQNKANADYGVGFNKEMEQINIFYTYDSEGKWMKTVRRMPGIITFTPGYSNKYEKTRKGTVLSINRNKGTFNYYPSYPVALRADWSQGKNNVLYYGLVPASYYGERSKIKELMVWWQYEEGRSDSFQEFEPDSMCEGWSDRKYLGKVMLGSVSPWRAVVFVPADATELALELVCAKEPTILTATPYEGTAESTSETTSVSGGLVSLNEQRGRYAAIQDYIDKIAAGEICVNNGLSRDFIELRWNPYIPGLTDEFIALPEEAEGE